jgi:spore germination protein KC
MPSRLVVAILVILMITSVVTDNGATETDEVAWIITIGLDKGDEGNLKVTYRVSVPIALAGSEIGDGKKETSVLISLQAASLAEARNLLNVQLSRKVNLSQTKTIVIGEDLAREGLEDILGPLLRFREFRESMFLLLVKGTAEDVLKENKPELETLPSRWVENIFHNSNETGYYLQTTLHDFYVRLKAASGAPYIAAIAVNPETGRQESEGKLAPEEKTMQYKVGNIPKTSGNPVEIGGIGVFKKDKLMGYLTGEQTRILSILTNNLTASYMTIADPIFPQKKINVQIRNGARPKISVDINGERPIIFVELNMEGEITSIGSGVNYESPEYLHAVEAEISDIIQEQAEKTIALTQSWGADPFDFGYYVRPKFSTYKQFEDFDWNSRYNTATVKVNIRTSIRRMGLMRKTVAIKEE